MDPAGAHTVAARALILAARTASNAKREQEALDALRGLEGLAVGLVEIESGIGRAVGHFDLAGSPYTSVREAAARVRQRWLAIFRHGGPLATDDLPPTSILVEGGLALGLNVMLPNSVPVNVEQSSTWQATVGRRRYTCAWSRGPP